MGSGMFKYTGKGGWAAGRGGNHLGVKGNKGGAMKRQKLDRMKSFRMSFRYSC